MTEWAFRSGLDRYIVPFGMAVSYAVVRSKGPAAPLLPSGGGGDAVAATSSVGHSPMASARPLAAHPGLAAAASMSVLLAYVAFAARCPAKPACNAVHAWASLFGVLAFALLRNAHPAARGVYSRLLAAAGQNSLELFLAQYHVWLALDTRAVLTLLPGWPLLNALLASWVFAVVADQLADTFGFFAGVLVPAGSDTVTLVTRLVLFTAGVLALGLAQEWVTATATTGALPG